MTIDLDDKIPDDFGGLMITGRFSASTTITDILAFHSPRPCFLCGTEHFPIPARTYGEVPHTNLCRECRRLPNAQELKHLEVQRRLANSPIPMMPQTQVPRQLIFDSLSSLTQADKGAVLDPKKSFTKGLLKRLGVKK